MKYYICLLSILLNLNAFTQVQRNNILPASTKITINVIAQDGRLALISQYVNDDDFININAPTLIDADLYIDFEVELPKDAAYCLLRAELSNEKRDIITETAIEIGQSQKTTIILFDITEKGLYLNEQYQLTIYHDLIGNKPCEAIRPEFNWNEKKWPVLATSLGFIGLSVSEIGLKAKQTAEYKDYTDLWKAGNVPESDAEPFRKNAEDTKDLRRIATWGSGLLVAGGLIWYVINKRKINKRKVQYDRYCKPLPNLSIDSKLGYRSDKTTLGIKLSYQF